MADWISFFDSDNPIYVNARHRAVHARLVALSIGQYIRKPGMSILDYGCGEAFYAGRIAEQSGTLMLCEAAPHLRQSLKERFADNEKIAVLSPEEAAALPDAQRRSHRHAFGRAISDQGSGARSLRPVPPSVAQGRIVRSGRCGEAGRLGLHRCRRPSRPCRRQRIFLRGVVRARAHVAVGLPQAAASRPG